MTRFCKRVLVGGKVFICCCGIERSTRRFFQPGSPHPAAPCCLLPGDPQQQHRGELPKSIGGCWAHHHGPGLPAHPEGLSFSLRISQKQRVLQTHLLPGQGVGRRRGRGGSREWSHQLQARPRGSYQPPRSNKPFEYSLRGVTSASPSQTRTHLLSYAARAPGRRPLGEKEPVRWV